MHAVSVEPTALMGPGDHHFITGTLIQNAARGDLFPFPEGGSNFIDVRDAAQGHIAAAENGKPGARYILGAHNMTHVECVSYHLQCGWDAFPLCTTASMDHSARG